MTREEMLFAIEEIYDCEEGDPRSYHEVLGAQYPYHTLIEFSTQVPNFDSLRLYLVQRLKNISLLPPRTHKPKLYWRLAEKIQEETGRHSRSLQLRTRVAIPGIDWALVRTDDEL